jgi:hypothetical protein
VDVSRPRWKMPRIRFSVSTRFIYFCFGVSGVAVDIMFHTLVNGGGSLWVGLQTAAGINMNLIDYPVLFGLGIGAHSMFLLAFVLLFLRAQ